MDKAPAPRAAADTTVDPETRAEIVRDLRTICGGKIPAWLPDEAALDAYAADVAAAADGGPEWTDARYRRLAALLAPHMPPPDNRRRRAS